MKVLIIGGSGMLGHKIVQVLQEKFEVWTTIRNDFERYRKYKVFDKERTLDNINVENIKKLESVIKNVKPDVIINAVGIIKQIRDSKNVIKNLQINSIFPHQLAAISESIQARLINISTDCVFNGTKGNYSENDIPDADDLYGKSKNLGEVISENCLTIRTSIIGREIETANSLVEWFLSNQEKKVKGFTNAIYSGFPTVYLAEIIYDLIVNFNNLSGLYHISSEPISKFELLKLINKAYDAGIEIERFEDFKIDRSLDSSKFRAVTGFSSPDWESLVNMLANDKTPYSEWK